MNRRSFIGSVVGLLAALPFVRRLARVEAPEFIAPLREFTDEFSWTDAEIKAEYPDPFRELGPTVEEWENAQALPPAYRQPRCKGVPVAYRPRLS